MSGKQGKLSSLDYYKNGEFFYPWEDFNPETDDVIKWSLTRKQEKWPDFVPLPDDIPEVVERVDGERIFATFIGHATVLIQHNGVNIITDPVFSDRASPVSWAGPKRVQAPGVPLEKLPPIDIVLITHDHYDHLDIKSIVKINEKHKPLFIVPEGIDKILIKNGVSNIKTLLWWESFSNNSVTIHLVPSKHWSKRGAIGRNRTLWGSFVIQSIYHNIFFIGDSGFGPHLQKIAERFGSMRLSFLPLGAYLPEWFMKKQHMSPEDAIETHIILKSQQSIGIHFDTFPLADEGYGDGTKRLERYLQKKGMDKDVFIPLKAGKRLEIN
ncbi:MBL fold metallo-hydrolase [bacterium]|nr:MBL fold metallo-hydrolase [bacterium]